MPFDGIVTSAAVWELKGLLQGGRIEKVYQTEKDEILLVIHSSGEKVRLLLSASTKNPRMHLTKSKKENPALPPPFCMVLRKHIQGGRIVSVTQSGYDRIVTLCIEIPNEMGDLVQKNLIIEIMGKHSNIILTNSNGLIYDAIKHVDDRISRVREVLPLRQYVSPPPQDKLSPANNETADFVIASAKENPTVRTDKHILNNISGFSPFLITSICNRSGVDPFTTLNSLSSYDKDELKKCLYSVIDDIKSNSYAPVILQSEKKDFHVMRVTHTGEMKAYNTVNLMLDEFYTLSDSEERLNARKASLLKNTNNSIERNKRKILLLEDIMTEAYKYDEYRVKGEILYTNIFRLKEGKEEVELENYYDDPPTTIKIEMNPNISIVNNANLYFKKYKKLKSSYENASMQIRETKQELFYIENIKTHLDNSTEFNDIEEIKQELTEQGYIKADRKKAKKTQVPHSGPIHKVSSEGYDIYIGKNNKQNDELTLKIAFSNDMWLHVKDAPGSHVIIRTGAKNGVVTNLVLQEAAMIAAFYSSQRTSTNVTVDFTRVKNVKKPSGARPGMVNYVGYKSINVKPANFP